MAIDLTVQYPGKVGTASPSWPFGEPRNITTPGDGTGTPWEEAIVKDTEAYKQALLTASSIVPSGTPDNVSNSQIMQALVEQVMGRPVRCAVTGTVNDYVLTPAANQYGAASLFDGLTVEWVSLGGNSGPMTINYNGLGVVNLVTPDGLAVNLGQITGGGAIYLRATYDGVGAVWVLHVNLLENGSGPILLDVPTSIVSGSSSATIAWTTQADATLTAVKARIAILELRLRLTSTTAGGNGFIKVAKGGTGPSFTTSIPASVQAVSSGVGDNDNDNNTIMVNLDSLHRFDWELTVVGAPGVFSYQIMLMGYYKKYGQRDF